MLHDDNYVGRMTTSGTFRMIGMDSPAFDRSECALDITAFVEGVGMNVELVPREHYIESTESSKDGN